MKLSIAEEEADETCYWLELLLKTGLSPEDMINPVLSEARQITAILTSSVRTARRNAKKS
jgi:four helix bundle protein